MDGVGTFTQPPQRLSSDYSDHNQVGVRGRESVFMQDYSLAVQSLLRRQ